jgi:hypothetical protein
VDAECGASSTGLERTALSGSVGALIAEDHGWTINYNF